MPTISKDLFDLVECKLFDQARLVSDAVKHRDRIEADIIHGTASRDPRTGGVKGGSKVSVTEAKAMRLVEAGNLVTNARSWVSCINAAAVYYDGMTAGKVAALYYGERMDRGKVAKALGVNVKTVDRERDRFVTTVAIYAAARGLIKPMHEEGEDE